MTEYYEDLAVGDVRGFGDYTVSADELVRFAEQYDPQPFHVDGDAAERSMFGGLIASGWHTASVTMRMLVEHELADSGATGALGVDDLRWPNPVRPGDTLSVRTEIVEKEPWRGDLGLVHTETTTLNQDDEIVMSMVGLVLYERRETE
jgi:acyl dehydratase